MRSSKESRMVAEEPTLLFNVFNHQFISKDLLNMKFRGKF